MLPDHASAVPSRMKRPDYEALDAHGLPYVRPARVVGELPTPEERRAALESATLALASQLNLKPKANIPFGAPVFLAFGLTRPQAKNHAMASLLLLKGDALPLDHCPVFLAEAHKP